MYNKIRNIIYQLLLKHRHTVVSVRKPVLRTIYSQNLDLETLLPIQVIFSVSFWGFHIIGWLLHCFTQLANLLKPPNQIIKGNI